jgi:hypothetical protein
MEYYDYFLKIYGLEYWIKKKSNIDRDDNIEQDHEDHMELREIVLMIGDDGNVVSNYVEADQAFYKSLITRSIINHLYMLIILFFIAYPCIYGIVKAIIDHEAKYFTSSIFNWMYLVQYICGLFFYYNNYFKSSMAKLEQYKMRILISYSISIVICIILSSLSVVMLNSGINITLYSPTYNEFEIGGKIGMSFVITLQSFFAHNIFFVNVISFASILILEKMNISEFKNNLINLVGQQGNSVTVNRLVDEYAMLKIKHHGVIEALNNMFASITIFGLVGCYFTIINFNTKFVDPITYINIVCFLLVECIYVYSIYKIKQNIADIKTIIDSPQFTNKFLERSDLSTSHGDIYADYDNNATLSLSTNGSDLIIDGGTSPRSPLSQTTRIASKLFQQNKKYFKDKEKKTPNLDKKVDVVKTMVFRNIIISHEIEGQLDFTILNTKLVEPWECFSIFGFEFDDVSIIQKLITIVIMMLGILQLDSKLGF